MEEPVKRYKILGRGGVSCNGGNGQWSLPREGQPGEWMPFIADIIPCKRGYHLCRKEDLMHWLNAEIYEAEGRGDFIRDENNKDVFPEARLIIKLDTWNERSARLFAADCAEHVLHIFEKKFPMDDRPRKAIQAARNFANGLISKKELAAARYSERSAAMAAAAARDTVMYAESSADAAMCTVMSAARCAAAARDADWAAALDAEIKWQTKKLYEYLGI
jgi:hypothetical protein